MQELANLLEAVPQQQHSLTGIYPGAATVDCCLPGQSDDYEAVIVVLTIRRFHFHLVCSIYSGSSWPNYCAFGVSPPLTSVSQLIVRAINEIRSVFAKLWETQRQPSVKHTPAESHPFAII